MRRLQVCVSALGPFLWVVCGLGQHRGDPLAFQGLEKHNEMAPRALAVGGAYYAHAGDLSCLFYNPAGLAALRKPSVSVTAESFTQRWWENQVYRPNRMFVTLPFYLQRLYIPDPANNGRWDYEIWIEERDSTYIVQEPKLGL
ncbi:MAG: hypothetical protein ONB23_05465, partial [candidate division KSB1 bacterium]|nr:hypothetical protein [candidate division KSB1 bacterium]